MDFSKYKDQSAETIERFRHDMLKELGLLAHDKAEWAWDLAWKHGHKYGFEEVFFQLLDLAKLLKKDENETNKKLH